MYDTFLVFCLTLSVGITEKKFGINDTLFHIFDVGGQKSERKKWIQCFDRVKAVVFVVSLDCYNEIMFEDGNKNCLEDSLELFNQTVNNETFADTPVILFLNKCDLFEPKIKELPITECPVFENSEIDDPNDYQQAIELIKDEFQSQCNNHEREIYMHVTCAMDDVNIENVFKDVTKMVINQVTKRLQELSIFEKIDDTDFN